MKDPPYSDPGNCDAPTRFVEVVQIRASRGTVRKQGRASASLRIARSL